MGAKKSKQELPNHIKEKVLKLFQVIDVDNSKTIDREETLRYWSKNFPKLNSNELFDQVDKNNDGSIQINEWIEFWTIVLNSGHTEDEVSSELDNLLSGGSWVKFENVDNARGKTNTAKQHGKY